MRSTTKTEMGLAATAGRLAAFLAVLAGAIAWLAESPEASALQPPRQDTAAPAFAGPVPVRAPAPAPPPISGSALGLILHGVSGGAAIIGSGTGGQRLVRIGKELQPGLKLTEIGSDYAVLVTGGQPMRLELRRFGGPSAQGAPARSASERERGIESAVLRHVLRPVVSNGRVGGYALKGGESIPQLQKAGLRAGDVILSVNGSQLDEERMNELAWEMRNASKTDFVFLRNGKTMRTTL